MNVICRTCGTTLHSGLSRDYGQCGACRVTEDALTEQDVRTQDEGPRVSPWHDKDITPDKLRT